MFVLLATLLSTPTLFAQETSANDETASDNEARLIREDRIWEYSSCWGFWQPATFQMKFNGTVEKDGKTWHRLQVINSSKYFYGGDKTTDVKYTEYEPTEGFLMREENGIVYLYDPYSYVKDAPDVHEFVLYNFNLEEGDTMDAWMNFGNYETREATKVEIITDKKGVQRKRITLLPKEGVFGYGEVEVVEGIGVVSTGTLPFIETDAMTDPYSDEDGTTYPNRFHGESLQCVMDLAGNVIYGDPVTAVESAVADQLTLSAAADMATAASSATAAVRIKAVSADGITVADSEGNGSVSIDLSQLPAGIYVIHASDGAATRTAKIVVR